MGDIITFNVNTGDKMANKRRTYSQEFKLESAQLVVDQGYTVKAAAEAIGVGKSTLEYWIRQLRAERQGATPTSSALTPEQCRIQELEKKLRRVEQEKDILKKATALLISDSLNNLR